MNGPMHASKEELMTALKAMLPMWQPIAGFPHGQEHHEVPRLVREGDGTMHVAWWNDRHDRIETRYGVPQDMTHWMEIPDYEPV